MTLRSSPRELFFELSVDMLCIANTAGQFIDVNEAWTTTTGWTADELCASPFTDFVHPDDVEATVNEAMALSEGHDTVHFENRYRCKDGSYVWLSWKSTTVASPDDEPLIFAVAHNITERKDLEASLRHLADHDALTGVWGRRRFEQEVEKQVARSQRYEEQAALFLLDLDLFKEVNDTHGHGVGDQLLKHVANTLSARVRASDSVARFGGDEFAILLPHLAPDEAAHTAEVVADYLRDHPLTIGTKTIPITASAGIAFLDATTVSADAVMVDADRAMYDAKANGRDRISGLRRPAGMAPAQQTRVFHCDDSEAYRRLFASMLDAHADMDVVGGAEDHVSALAAITTERPDVIVLDARMGEQNAVDFVQAIRASSPTSGVLILSGLEACPEPLASQTDGFISKRSTFDDVADAIRRARRATRT